MVILFTPRRLSSYNATFTLSAKNNYNFPFYSMNSILIYEDRAELIYYSKHERVTNSEHIIYGNWTSIDLEPETRQNKSSGGSKTIFVCLQTQQTGGSASFNGIENGTRSNVKHLIRLVIGFKEYVHACTVNSLKSEQTHTHTDVAPDNPSLCLRVISVFNWHFLPQVNLLSTDKICLLAF